MLLNYNFSSRFRSLNVFSLVFYILGEATNPSLGSKKRLGDHQIQENGASMLKVARVNH